MINWFFRLSICVFCYLRGVATQNIAGMATMVPTSTNDPSRSGYLNNLPRPRFRRFSSEWPQSCGIKGELRHDANGHRPTNALTCDALSVSGNQFTNPITWNIGQRKSDLRPPRSFRIPLRNICFEDGFRDGLHACSENPIRSS